MSLQACRGPVYCSCGDRLIHQSSRGPHESSSLLGQHVHDCYRRTFDYLDVDGLIWKQSTRRLVVIEHKYPGQALSDAQRRVLPVMSRIVARAVQSGDIRSGDVALLYGAPPFDTATVTLYSDEQTFDLTRPMVDHFLQGGVL